MGGQVIDRNVIISRIQKLFALAGNSPNEAEVASALRQAQYLMDKYRIDAASVEVREEQEAVSDDVLFTCNGDFIPQWQWNIAQAMCVTSLCKSFVDHYRAQGEKCKECGRGRSTTDHDDWNDRTRRTVASHLFRGVKRATICVIGRPSDASMVRYMLQYVLAQVERIAKAEYEDRGKPGQKWLWAFKTGCAERVADRIMQAWRESQVQIRADVSNANAIVRLDEVGLAVKNYGKEKLKLRATGASHTDYNGQAAHAAGYRAGSAVNVSRQGGKGIAGPSKQIGGTK